MIKIEEFRQYILSMQVDKMHICECYNQFWTCKHVFIYKYKKTQTDIDYFYNEIIISCNRAKLYQDIQVNFIWQSHWLRYSFDFIFVEFTVLHKATNVYMYTVTLLHTDRAVWRYRLAGQGVCDELKPARASHLQ